MAGVPKHLKKHAKNAMNGVETNIGKSRLQWSFEVGDLVFSPANKVYGVVVKATSAGWLEVLSSAGQASWHASKVDRIQTDKND